jgi:hypothetical protein
MTSCSLGLRGPTSPMARSVYVSASVAAMPTALASMTTTLGYFPVCRLASRTLRSNARALADCKVLNSALKRRPPAVTSSASPPGTLRPLSKTCMSNRSANVSAIAISRGSGSLLGLMFLALLTFLWVATRTRSAGDVAFNQCPAVKKVLRHGPVRRSSRYTFSLFVHTHCKDSPGWEALLLVHHGLQAATTDVWYSNVASPRPTAHQCPRTNGGVSRNEVSDEYPARRR